MTTLADEAGAADLSGAAIEARDVRRVYKLDGVEVAALRGVSLRIDEGEYVAITGPSGSGKSTLMHLLGCLDRPTSGTLLIGGRDIAKLGDADLAQVRNEEIGFVFQAFQLLARTSALDNVALPLIYRGVGRGERRRRAKAALAAVHLDHRLGHRPTQLSGGEQQRVAIARALVGEPRVLLADEPTGNLDTANGEEVMAILERLNRERGVAVVLVTHEAEIAKRARRLIRIRDGVIVEDTATAATVERPYPAVAPGEPGLDDTLVDGVAITEDVSLERGRATGQV
ncbi:ABC transporter ATP-binding protein [Actinocrinis sp.]|uniref:ABC transporter ATP-binding protein n=1 Tax=Actinocrinis sp. TaxID=1920516 RepID=UPI002D6CC1FA|nr:ABC transporter ATP-binding protein [Actinocrinis sp.]HZP50836.1 ABC transporter ATP-binding protein [Actinocrinis sp.]